MTKKNSPKRKSAPEAPVEATEPTTLTPVEAPEASAPIAAPEPTTPPPVEAPPAPNPAILAGLRDAHSQGRARRARESEAVATLGSVACNVGRDGAVTVKVQGFLPLDVALALRACALPGESNTATLERILRGALPPVSPEALAAGYAAVAKARASAPTAPSARARAERAPVAPVREVLR